MIRGHILVFDGFDELDVVGPYEVFAKAAEAGADVVVELVSTAGRASAIGAYRLRLDTQSMPGSGPDLNLVLVPGGGWLTRSVAGAWSEVQSGEIFDVLDAYLDQPDICVASVCTGSLILAHSGRFADKVMTTHPSACADLAATGAKVAVERVVEDGQLVTGGGVVSGIDLALAVLARFEGDVLAETVAQRLDHRWSRPMPASLASMWSPEGEA